MKKIILIILLVALVCLCIEVAQAQSCDDCKNWYETCLQGCGEEDWDCMRECWFEWHSTYHCNDTCKDQLNNWIVLNCNEGYFFPGSYPLNSCTITSDQTLYSKGFTLPFEFDSFNITSEAKLTIKEKDAQAGGGGAGSKGGCGGGDCAQCVEDEKDCPCKEKGCQCACGGDGGEGGALRQKGKSGTEGNNFVNCGGHPPGAGGKGGEPGGSIMIKANVTIVMGWLSADGESGNNGTNGAGTKGCRGADEASGGGGGGGGAGGGIITIETNELHGSGNITANGGDGGDGGDGGTDSDTDLSKYGDEGGGGGGGGGCGVAGKVHIIVNRIMDFNGEMISKGGDGGDGGSGNSGGKNGGSAADCEDEYVQLEKRYCEFHDNPLNYLSYVTHPDGAFWCDYVKNYDPEVGGDKIGSAHWCFRCNKGKIEPVQPAELKSRGLLCFSPTPDLAVTPPNYWDQCLLKENKTDCDALIVEDHHVCNWTEEGDWKGCIPRYSSGIAECEKGDGKLLIGTGPSADIQASLNVTREYVEINGEKCNLSDYYWNFTNCIAEKLNNALSGNQTYKDWLKFMIKKCTAIGDCGNNSHYLDDLNIPQVGKIDFFENSGYDLIPLIPALGDSVIGLRFRCQRLEPKFRHPSEGKCEKGNLNQVIGWHRNVTDYFCSTLGSNCEYNETNKECTSYFDTALPTITSIDLEATGISCNINPSLPIAGQQATIECVADKCIPPYTSLSISYSTDEPTICKWMAWPFGKQPAFVKPEDLNWSAFSSADNEANKYKKDHQFDISPDMFPLSPFLDKPMNVTAFLLCKDRSNHMQYPYIFNYCLSNNDYKPPLIKASIPNQSYLSTGVKTTDIEVNEPVSSCKWGYGVSVPTDWDSLPNTIEGNQFIPEDDGWRKTTIEFEMGQTELSFYIMCKDLTNNSGALYLVFNPVSHGLNLTIESPLNGSIITGCESPVSVALRVVTAGDVGDGEGRANCEYSNDSVHWNTFGVNTSLSTKDLYLGNGTYTYYVECIDTYGQGLIAKNQTTFTVVIDREAPNITRIYKEGNNLVIHTNEPATCAFNKFGNNCNFDATDWFYAANFSTTGNLVHKTPWRNEKWYVKCYDKCSNGAKADEGCTIILPQKF